MFSNLYSKDRVYKNLVGGNWKGGNISENIDIFSPINNIEVGKVPSMTRDDVDEVIKEAHKAKKAWEGTSIGDKAEILYNTARLIDENLDKLSDLLVLEIGKDKKSAISEVERTADFIRFTADTSRTIAGEIIKGESFPKSDRKKISLVDRVPVGVVLAISPFNYPINLSASKIAPALMAGNTVILKPATQGSISALCLAEMFHKAGIPNGVLNTVTGKGSDIGDYIVTHEGINFINFTGSTEVGSRISKITAMVPTLMELGGKDAAIVLEDADLKSTVKNIVDGAFSYSAQRCTAIKRVVVINDICDELISLLKEEINKLKIGNPLKEQVTIVPLINSKAADFVQDLIDDAKEKGAKVITGDKKVNNLVYPTLLDNVTEDMRVAWEEPFGPVLPVIRVKDIDEAIEIANKSKYGLQSAVFTKDIDKAFYVANRLEVGTVQVNNKTERGPDNFPFLGVKESGFGAQGIRYSIEAMSRIKCTVIKIDKN